MRQVTVSAKTVESAVDDALRQLQIGRDRADVIVKVAPSKGFFGFGARDAVVDVSIIEDPVGDAERFLREMFVAMRLSVRIASDVKGQDVTFSLHGDKVGLLIGKHGQTLDAIQHLVNAIGNKYADKTYRFIVDAEGYRERRRQALTYMATKMAEKAIATGREVRLEPMSAVERKIIHVTLQNRQDVKTESRGTEPARAIVIIPMDAKSAQSKTRGGERAPQRARS